MAKKIGGSGTNLRNIISMIPMACEPQERNDQLRPFVWVGGWTRSSPGDQAVIKKILGSDNYEETESPIILESQKTDSLFYVDAEIVSLYSKHQAWSMFASAVQVNEFDAFLETAVEVLSERNPLLDIPAEERFYANIRGGQSPIYSGVIKRNIAENLACIASLCDTETIAFPGIDKRTIQYRIDQTVSKILRPDMDSVEWASLGQSLILLAEASPATFIGAVRNEIKKEKDSCFVDLMRDDGIPMLSGCNHASLLWALETLSYSKQYHAEAVKLLLELAEIDPGGKWGNRPWSSLIEIYCPWHLRSDVSVESRIELLDSLLKTHENRTWKLLYNIAVDTPYIAANINYPSWRNWGLGINHNVDNESYGILMEECAKRVLDHLGEDFYRWEKTVSGISAFQRSNTQNRIIQLLQSLGNNVPNQWTDFQKAELVDIARDLLRREDKRSGEDKSLSAETRQCLYEFMENMKPDNSIARNVWLFGHNAIFHFQGDNYEESTARLSAEQNKAIEDIVDQHGFEGIASLVRHVKKADSVGWMLGKIFSDRFLDEIIPRFLESEFENERGFARSFIYVVCANGKSDWDKFNKKRGKYPLEIISWPIETAVRFFSALHPNKALWDWLEEFDDRIQIGYWKNQHGWFNVNSDWTAEVFEFVLRKLLDVRNYSAALIFVAHGGRKERMSSDALLSLLEEIISHFDDVKQQTHEIQELIEFLQYQFKQSLLSNEEEVRLARIELFFIRLFYYPDHRRPITLETFLIKDPAFFVDALKIAFKPSEEELDGNYHEDENPHAAASGTGIYTLLMHWNCLPGENDGNIDYETLKEWVEQSRSLAGQCARLEICEYQIGELFARCSLEVLEGKIPRTEILDILEATESDAMFRGYNIGLFNGRGMTSRSPFDGGKLERELAEKYESLAKQCMNKYPNVADVFQSLAMQYLDHAKREDESAARNKLF